YTVSATATDGRGGSVSASAGTVTIAAPSGPQFSAALVSWSGSADLNVRVAGPGGIDVATQNGGRLVPAGCGTGNRTESVLYQGSSLPSGSYTVFVKHTDSCGGSPTAITFSYTVQSTAGMKCGGFGSV